ncbi:hypothetical protein [Lentilactobacillus senioris]|uniref:hypothetical protein n=1 Tax=Lentilactobacillus senioris TaxID=931534 RepID=UPI0006CFF03E|nr:hypothetical protein [Lentilactobacillus senioris]
MNFDEIRGNALANKNDFNELAELARQMSSEKANFSSVVAWFRNRKRMLSRSFEPIKNSMNTKKNDEVEEMEAIVQYAERALSLTEDQELESAWKFIDRIESYYDMDLGLKSNSPPKSN